MSTPPAFSLQTFVTQLDDAFLQAQRQTGSNQHWLNVAGCRIRLCFAGPSLQPVLWPALAHLAITSTNAADVTFYAWDRASSSITLPRLPFKVTDYTRYGQRALADDGTVAVMHAPTVSLLFAYNRATRHGYFYTADAASLSIYERAAPMQTLFYWALAEFGWQIVHAAAVGTAQGGVLLIGSTGAGKSTTALSCLAQPGLHFLSDDKCLVRLEPEPQAFALFSSAKLKADMLPYLAHLQPHIAGWDDARQTGKSLMYLHPAFAGQIITSFPVKALLLPQANHQSQATIHPVPRSNAFRQLGPSTVIWLPGAEADNYRFDAELTRWLPCYRLNLAREPLANMATILALLDSL